MGNFVNITLLGLLCLVFTGCNNSTSNENTTSIELTSKENENITESKGKKIDFSNPALLSLGTDIGTAFKAFYLTGQIEKMMQLTSSKTIDSIGRNQLEMAYQNLDFGFDMSFYGMIEKDSLFYLQYKCEIQATKVKKTLKVCIENDSSKIIPFDPIGGAIFID